MSSKKLEVARVKWNWMEVSLDEYLNYLSPNKEYLKKHIEDILSINIEEIESDEFCKEGGYYNYTLLNREYKIVTFFYSGSDDISCYVELKFNDKTFRIYPYSNIYRFKEHKVNYEEMKYDVKKNIEEVKKMEEMIGFLKDNNADFAKIKPTEEQIRQLLETIEQLKNNLA